MHEHALMDDLMRKIAELAREQGGARIAAVKVWLGALSHMTPEHFREHWEDAARGGPAEKARVEVEASSDLHDPNARGIVLRSVDVEDAGDKASRKALS